MVTGPSKQHPSTRVETGVDALAGDAPNSLVADSLTAGQAGASSLVVGLAGTGTGVGKTWVGARLAAELRSQGWLVSARKPVESFDPGDPVDQRDSTVLATATGEPTDTVCPPHRRYPLAMAPPIAARRLGFEPFTVPDLVAEHLRRRPARRGDIELVELVGGVRSPLAGGHADCDGPHPGDDGAAFLAAIGADLSVLVADASLGAIDSVRTHAAALALTVPGTAILVYLNRFDASDPIAVDNRDWLCTIDGFVVSTSIAELTAAVLGARVLWCAACGQRGCPGGCRSELEADRFCRRCGRKLAVKISPVRTSASCSVHGAQTT